MTDTQFRALANADIKRLMQRGPACHLVRFVADYGTYLATPACECDLIDGDELSSLVLDVTCHDCLAWFEDDQAVQADDWAAGQAL